MKVSVVIPTRNRRRSLARTLAALRDEDCHEVIVVDDGSSDGTLRELAAEAERRPELRYLAADGIGSGPARAAGAAQATGEVVLFLDDDVVLAPGVVAGHARRHRSADGIVVAGYYPVALGPGMPATTRFLARSYERDLEAVSADPSLGFFRLWGGLLSIRRADLARVPLTTPEFDGRRHGDLEFGLRCHAAGLRFVFDPELRGRHYYERTLAEAREDARRSGYGAASVALLHPELGSPALPESRHRAVTAFLQVTDRQPAYRAATSTLELAVRASEALRLRRGADLGLAALLLADKRHGARERLEDAEVRPRRARRDARPAEQA